MSSENESQVILIDESEDKENWIVGYTIDDKSDSESTDKEKQKENIPDKELKIHEEPSTSNFPIEIFDDDVEEISDDEIIIIKDEIGTSDLQFLESWNNNEEEKESDSENSLIGYINLDTTITKVTNKKKEKKKAPVNLLLENGSCEIFSMNTVKNLENIPVAKENTHVKEVPAQIDVDVQGPNGQSSADDTATIYDLKIEDENFQDNNMCENNIVAGSSNQVIRPPDIEVIWTRENDLEFLKDESNEYNDEDGEKLGHLTDTDLVDSEKNGQTFTFYISRTTDASGNDFQPENLGDQFQSRSSSAEFKAANCEDELQSINSGASSSRGIKRKRPTYPNKLQAWERAVLKSSIDTNLKYEILYIQPIYNSSEELSGQTSFAVVGDRNGQVGYGIQFDSCRVTAVRGSIERALADAFRMNLVAYKAKAKLRFTISRICTGSSGGLTMALAPSFDGSGIQNGSIFISKILKYAGIDDCVISISNESKYIGHIGIALCRALRKMQTVDKRENA